MKAPRRPGHSGPPPGTYQVTPEASKDNAFCWLTWECDPSWVPDAPQGRGRFGQGDEVSRAQTQRIENLRAMGIDPLHIPGLGSQRRYDEAKFAIQIPTRRRA